jgi:hypothetical protein
MKYSTFRKLILCKSGAKMTKDSFRLRPLDKASLEREFFCRILGAARSDYEQPYLHRYNAD